jgi:capsular exopolysaccharide synthesis family protein
MSVLIVALTIMAFASLVTLAMPKKYTATTQLYFSVTAESVTELAQGSTFAEGQMSSYAKVATSPKVLDAVIREVPLSTTAEELAKSVVVRVTPKTVVLDIAATDRDPRRAAEIANAVGVELANVAEELVPDRADGSEAVRVTTVASAQIPDEPSSPKVIRNLALGLVLGVLLGFGLAVARHVLDTKVNSEEDVRRLTKIPILGAVPVDVEVPRHPVILRSEPNSVSSESVRRLRTNLQFVDVVNRAKSVVITSSIGDEGKSTIAINLAVAFADTGARVILIDADLRRPSVAQYLGIEGSVGLTTVLIGRADVEDIVQPFGTSTLNVLPTGPIPPNPSELLGSPAMGGLLDRLTATYDIVLLDSPPLLPVTDAAVLSKLAGGLLLVVGADRIHRPQLQETLVSLETAGSNVFGIVLNKIDRKNQARYTYGGGYAPRPGDGSTAAGQMIPNWDWDGSAVDPKPLGASDGSAIVTMDQFAASPKQDVSAAPPQDLAASAKQEAAAARQNGSGPAQQNTNVRAEQDKSAAAQQNVTLLANPEADPAKQNGSRPAQQATNVRGEQDKSAAAQQNITALAKQDEGALTSRRELVTADKDEAAPGEEENAALERRNQGEPPAWPPPPWPAEPVASQFRRAHHRRSKSRRR